MCYVWPCCCEDRLELTTNSTASKGNTKGAAKVSRSVRSRLTRNCKNRRCDKHTNGETCRGKDRLSSSSKCRALFTIQRSNTSRLFQNLRTLLAAPSKGTTLRERADSQTRVPSQGSSEHYTTPRDTCLSQTDREQNKEEG